MWRVCSVEYWYYHHFVKNAVLYFEWLVELHGVNIVGVACFILQNKFLYCGRCVLYIVEQVSILWALRALYCRTSFYIVGVTCFILQNKFLYCGRYVLYIVEQVSCFSPSITIAHVFYHQKICDFVNMSAMNGKVYTNTSSRQ